MNESINNGKNTYQTAGHVCFINHSYFHYVIILLLFILKYILCMLLLFYLQFQNFTSFLFIIFLIQALILLGEDYNFQLSDLLVSSLKCFIEYSYFYQHIIIF